MPKPEFRFKRFTVRQDRCALKVSTDGLLFGAWVDHLGAKRILDIGTGTGLLALIAAQRNEEAWIDAVEIDDDSAAQAAENVAASPWPDRIRVHRMDVRRMKTADRYDLILCNPPYYAGYSTSPDARIAVAKHSDELLFPDLLRAVEELLEQEGRFAAIIPIERELEFLKLAQGHGLHPAKRCVVSYVAHRPPKRLLIELQRQVGEVIYTSLTIEATGPFDYTPEYRALISDLMITS